MVATVGRKDVSRQARTRCRIGDRYRCRRHQLRTRCVETDGLVNLSASGETSWHKLTCAIVEGLRARSRACRRADCSNPNRRISGPSEARLTDSARCLPYAAALGNRICACARRIRQTLNSYGRHINLTPEAFSITSEWVKDVTGDRQAISSLLV